MNLDITYCICET